MDRESPQDLFEELDVLWIVTGLRPKPERLFVLSAPKK
jgi:hypothetical protein